MTAIITLLVVLSLSILVTRVAAVALTHTGLSRQAARFQARSAFTGVGFTTGESEKVVNHPVRRRILLTLMLVGNAGIITTVSSLILTFVAFEESESTGRNVFFLVAGLVLLWALASSSWVDRHIGNLISWALGRYTELDVKDYANLLHLSGEYRVSELYVHDDDWIANHTLREAGLRQEGILVLGINREDGTFLGTPEPDTGVVPGDVLILYGRASALEGVDRRRKGAIGDREHAAAVDEQEAVQEQEAREDPDAEGDHARPGS